MENKENNKIAITNIKGKRKEYEIISYITIDSGNYIVYTDETPIDNEKVALYVSQVSEDKDGIFFDTVSDEELKKVIENLKERLK